MNKLVSALIQGLFFFLCLLSCCVAPATAAATPAPIQFSFILLYNLDVEKEYARVQDNPSSNTNRQDRAHPGFCQAFVW